MKMWGKIWKNNHLLRDVVVSEDSDDTRTHKVFHLLQEICLAFDLSQPIWLDSGIREFKKHKRVRFTKDCFIDDIDFDYLEMMILEE